MRLTWSEVLKDEKEAEHFKRAYGFSLQERKRGKHIFPPQDKVFQAFTSTPFEDVRVVILGQDPYHGAGQAEGLSFSVPKEIQPPPSLQNIFKELHDDVGTPIPHHGHLAYWAEQGVFLLNAVLTVEEGKAASHQGKGWEQFTDSVIKKLSDHRSGIVFLLWGAYAQKKVELIDTTKHHILTTVHPSPLSAHRGFFGCKHFSKTNELLTKDGNKPIDWDLSNS